MPAQRRDGMTDTYHDEVIIKIWVNLDSTMVTRLFTDNPSRAEWKQCNKVSAGSVTHQLRVSFSLR
jgi:hypothetical protein